MDVVTSLLHEVLGTSLDIEIFPNNLCLGVIEIIGFFKKIGTSVELTIFVTIAFLDVFGLSDDNVELKELGIVSSISKI